MTKILRISKTVSPIQGATQTTHTSEPDIKRPPKGRYGSELKTKEKTTDSHMIETRTVSFISGASSPTNFPPTCKVQFGSPGTRPISL